MTHQISSLREQRHDGSATHLAVTITGEVSPPEQVDAIANFEQLSRDAEHRVRFARFRLEARVNADGLSRVDGVMILEDGRVLLGWSVDRTMPGAVNDFSRRLRAQIYASRRPVLDQTA